MDRNIYEEFEKERVISNVYKINEELDKELKKPLSERDKEHLLKLYQKQMMESIKLSNNIHF